MFGDDFVLFEKFNPILVFVLGQADTHLDENVMLFGCCVQFGRDGQRFGWFNNEAFLDASHRCIIPRDDAESASNSLQSAISVYLYAQQLQRSGTMATDDGKPSRNEVATSVRDELEGRRRFNEHYEVSVPDVEL